MKEIHDIVEKMQQLSSQQAVIATVVNVQGSTYRRPGARMLVTQNGDIVGAISGGCLEEDIKEKAEAVFASGEIQIVTYDMMSDEDIVWGLGLGCNGIVQVLLQRVDCSPLPSTLNFIIHCYEQETTGLMATIFSKTSNHLFGSTHYWKTTEDTNKVWTAIQTSDPTIFENKKRSKVLEIKVGTDKEKVLIERITPLSLLIFGAGFDAIPLADIAQRLGWKVTVCDPRETYLHPSRFPHAKRICEHPKKIHHQLDFNHNQFAVVMTHNYHHDLEILKQLCKTCIAYIGMLGPNKRTNKILNEIPTVDIDKIRKKIFGPIGLDIGSETSEEIATAIVAEILAVRNNRQGHHLKWHTGSIHNDC